jgi:hypothetical protein
MTTAFSPHSNPAPPHNPSTRRPQIDFVDRIPLFEEDDSDQRIWNKGGSNSIASMTMTNTKILKKNQ